MKTLEHVIRDEQGLHARPAGMLVKEACRFGSSVTLYDGSMAGDAKKIFSVMRLTLKQGQTLRLEIEGPDEEEAAQALQNFLEKTL